ncbi:MAG: fumarylacetoacetate hydrolase family protein [Peptococcales bacterium]|jgi:2-keto-4-pentenoate hydratase/2-oxohepta-3-ene-1,7-dioic acid hydratase in catechol pathway
MIIARFWDGNNVCFGLIENDLVKLINGNPFNDFEIAKKTWHIDEIQLLAPCTPSKIICIGLNYHDHAREMSLPVPTEPVVFLKPPSSVIGSGNNIIFPPLCTRMDYEAELAIVIGSITKDIDESEAEEKIFGYTCANDITARNLQPKNGQWTIAKSFDTFCPLGPYIITNIKANNLKISLRVNGELKQDSNTSQMIFSPTYLVSYLSKVMTLFPGDVIITGTPSGVGEIKPGDTVEVYIENIGKLVNKVTLK